MGTKRGKGAPSGETVVQRGAHGELQVRDGRKDGWSTEKREMFFDALAQTLNVTWSVAEVKMSESGVYALRRRDPVFAEEWDAIVNDGFAALKMELLRQARFGTARTEKARNPKTGRVAVQKIVETMPLGMAVRLLALHEAKLERQAARTMELERLRHAAGQDGRDDAAMAIIHERIAAVRERLDLPPDDPVSVQDADWSCGA